MDGHIKSHRRGLNTQRTHQYVIEANGVDSRPKAAALIGSRVVWKTPSGEELVGHVTKPHGKSGALLARFASGLPGQSLGTKVSIG